MDSRAFYRAKGQEILLEGSFYKETCRSETIEGLFHPVSLASLAKKAT